MIGAEFIGRRPGRARAGRQHLLRPRLLRPAPAVCGRLGRLRAVRLPGQGPASATASARSTPTASWSPSRRSRPRPARTWPITGLYFYDNDVVDDRPPTEPVRARRAGDHRPERRLPARRAARDADRPRPRVSPGWTPAPTTRCWRPASSSRCSSTARAYGSPAWRRSRCGWASSTPTQAYALGQALAKSGYGQYVMEIARADPPTLEAPRQASSAGRTGPSPPGGAIRSAIGGWVENNRAAPSPGRNGLAIIRWTARPRQAPGPGARPRCRAPVCAARWPAPAGRRCSSAPDASAWYSRDRLTAICTMPAAIGPSSAMRIMASGLERRCCRRRTDRAKIARFDSAVTMPASAPATEEMRMSRL